MIDDDIATAIHLVAGPRDDLIDELNVLLLTLTNDVAERAVRQLRAWLQLETDAHLAKLRGFEIAPIHCRPLVYRLDYQVRLHDDDPTVRVWRAWADHERSAST